MKKKNIIFPAFCVLVVCLLFSCKSDNIYDEMPAGKELTVAYEKLLKQNKLAKDSTECFLEIGSNFVIYPDNKVEQNQAAVYIIVERRGKGLYKYIYNMTSDKFDSYNISPADSVGGLFSHRIFPSFEDLDAVRDSLLKKSEIANPKIANLRFYISESSRKPEVEAIVEDIDNPGNSKTITN
ncbi:hypothetical protein CLV62_11456 [Dysgonomonas alginatilytica]|uniref:Lipoprotein n=1 Tax=Dysgonomonas alginatilytica TaxID=1605892 RepID=A0A2V3PPW4_9BACT|nr:hypothetical protein [Dysgonomonas alginatilytica]PXV63339.1 hypothetical protein CLV62_11456 [Dysgonomonas alginatilytica]